MTKSRLPKIVAAILFGTAMAVPTMLPSAALAQGRRDHDGRHDNGQHKGWDKNGKGDGDDRRRDRDEHRDRNDRRDHRNDHRGGYQVSDHFDSHRQTTKNNWRNLGYVGGAVGIAGLLTHNSTLAGLGLGGGLYSAYRYDQDRRSQDNDGRGRYELFRHTSFDHQGHHYERRERMKGGQKYYYFQRTR